MDQLNASLRLVGCEAELVDDFDELRWAVLAAGDDVDLGVVVAKMEELAGSFEVLEQAGRERGREELGWPRRPGGLDGPTGIEGNRLGAGDDFACPVPVSGPGQRRRSAAWGS